MRINDKTSDIEGYLLELEGIRPEELSEYKSDLKAKAACERYFEKIIEAVIDLAFLIIKDKGFKIPEEDKEAFDILSKESIISEELAERLKDAKGMRNILAHEYGQVDDEVVFRAITEEIEKDVEEFINSAKKLKF
jgi:uncharacterized protein YutE (UPF0331/DUF86 family)